MKGLQKIPSPCFPGKFILEIVPYPHPTLRYRSKPVRRVDRQLKSIVREMFELMYDARGIGLAANQVDLPLQLFIINISGNPDEGEELVFINPVIEMPKGTSQAEEGCLSLPGIYADVLRPAQIRISAYDLSGNAVEMTCDNLLARALQHEYDHLQGVLFIDRVADSEKRGFGQGGARRRRFPASSNARGIGLAANQVDLPLQLFIINISGNPDEGEELVFINPVIEMPKGTSQAEEGCLSLPGIYADVLRPAQIRISAYDLSGNAVEMTCDNLLARALQHEYDHLQGVLFIDRVADSEKRGLLAELDAFEIEYRAGLETGKWPSDSEIHKRLANLESIYC